MDLNHIFHTIHNEINPEVHHFRHGSHPGKEWYLKTILPNLDRFDDSARFIFHAWEELKASNPTLVNIVSIAYDWTGMPIEGYSSVWLNQKIDVVYQIINHQKVHFEFKAYGDGLKISGLAIENHLSGTGSRQSNDRSYYELIGIANFLKTYTCEAHSQAQRTKLRIIDDVDSYSSPINRN